MVYVHRYVEKGFFKPVVTLQSNVLFFLTSSKVMKPQQTIEGKMFQVMQYLGRSYLD